MESLDELLADLHSAATHMKKEQGRGYSQNNHTHTASASQSGFPVGGKPGSGEYQRRSSSSSDQRSKNSGARSSGASSGSGDYPVAPPLPPPPSREVMEEVAATEPIYEPQNIQYSRNSVSPRPSNTMPTKYSAPPARPANQSTLGANLNELDDLLDDLNSSKFIQDLSRSNSDTSLRSQPSPSVKVPPLTRPKPAKTSPKATVSFNVKVNEREYDPNTSDFTESNAGASSATKELDELMASLSQFKMNTNLPPVVDQPDGVPYAQVSKSPTPVSPTSPGSLTHASPRSPSPKPSELDNMLGSLESDMKGHGVSVSTKGLCGACAKPIVGQVITALGKIWHTEHFCCFNCKEELGTRSFFERDEMPYCESCYHRLFAPLCGKCNTAILDKCVTAMDTTWHMECFACHHCGRSLNDEVFHEKDGMPYCKDDYFASFAPRCGGCSQPIVEDFISTLNTQWHTHCFKCMECGINLTGGSFFDHDGLPYCETHYYAKRGSLCAGCQKPITGRCITAMFRKFHPEHFVCAFCLKQLNKGTFKEQNDKPYCHPCFVKLFG